MLPSAAGDDVTLLLKYFTLTETQKAQFEELGTLFKEWNQKINLVSRKDIDHLYLHHILYSLSIAKLISFTEGTSIIDVGTGGGFPGIPLAIMFPQCTFLMVDSTAKKIMVVNDIIKSLNLKNANGVQARAEEMKETADFVTGRAVADIRVFYTAVKKLIHKEARNQLGNGIIYLTGGDISKEIVPFNNRVTVYPIDNWFKEDYFETKKVVHIKL